MTLIFLVAPVLAAFALSVFLCGLIVWRGPRDLPDGGRKVQARAVPTSGGAAILAAAALTMLAFALMSGERLVFIAERTLAGGWGPHVALIVGAGLVGLWDDVRGMAARVKLVWLAGLSLFAAVAGFHAMPLDGFGHTGLSLWVGILGSALWLFVIMNAANFMDGSNGLAIGSLMVMIGAMAVIAFMFAFSIGGVANAVFVASLIVLAAMAGFLVWNLSGRLYAGDAGSLALGAAFGSLGLFALAYWREIGMREHDGALIWLPATLALPFLVDVFLTLIWRARRGENLMQAHRDHAYQLFLRAGWRHLPVALLWWAMSLLCAVAALWGAAQEDTGNVPVFLAMLGLFCGLWVWQRRSYGPRVASPGLNTPG